MVRAAAAIPVALVVALACALPQAGSAAAPSGPAKGAAAAQRAASAAKKRCAPKPRRSRARHGKRRRAVWVVRRTACTYLVGLPPVAAGNPAGGPGGSAQPAPAGGGPPGAGPVASTLGVEAYDFGSFVLRLSKTEVPAGKLTIYFRNKDVGAHNLWLEPPAAASGSAVRISDDVDGGGGATKSVTVSAGTYRLYCSLSGHEAMTKTLTVR
jgi:plastocyanin